MTPDELELAKAKDADAPAEPTTVEEAAAAAGVPAHDPFAPVPPPPNQEGREPTLEEKFEILQREVGRLTLLNEQEAGKVAILERELEKSSTAPQPEHYPGGSECQSMDRQFWTQVGELMHTYETRRTRSKEHRHTLLRYAMGRLQAELDALKF